MAVKRYDIHERDDGEIDMGEFVDGEYVTFDDYDALAARLASADIEATSLLMAMVQQWPDVHPDWKPLPDVAGKITQINNMVAGLRARLAEAEHLILRMAGEDYQRARFYVEKYDLTGERAAVSATACLGGAPHWWDINAVTGQTECRLCHKSPGPSAKESL